MAYGKDPSQTDQDQVTHDEGDDWADAFAATGLILLFVALAVVFVATQ